MASDADLQAMSAMVTAAMETSTKALIKFASTAKESAGPSGGFKQMDSALSGIAKNLAGPVGIAAGFYAAGKAVADFSDQRLKLSLFSKDVGFSADSIHGLRRAMFMAGKETGDADRAIGAIGSSLKDLQSRRYGSALYSDLMQLGPGMHEVAKELLTIADTGDFDKALRLMESKWAGWGPRTRHLVAQSFHVTESDIEAGFDRLNHHIDAKTQAAAEAQAKQIRQYRQMFADAWEYALGGVVDAIERNKNTFKDAKWLTPSEIGEMMGLPTGTVPAAGDWWKDKMTPKVIDDNKKLSYPAGEDPMGGDYQRPESLVGKVHGWLGKRSDAGTSGSTDFSSRGRTNDLIQVEADSNKTLRDIRDSLQRMETGVGETRSSNVGGGRRGLARRLGIDRQGGGGGDDVGDSGTQFEGGGGNTLRGKVGGGGGNTLRGKVGGGGGSVLGGRADVADVANLAGNEALEKQRASRMAEINDDPELHTNVLKMLALEESKGVPRTAAMEALLNRSVMTKNSIKQELFSGFYGPINRGGLSRQLGAGSRATSQAAMDAAGRGSNLIQGRTDQGAIGDPNASGPGRLKVPGTSGIYNYWQGKRGGHFYSHEESAAFAEQQNRLAAQIHARGMADSGTQFEGNDDVHARDMVDSTKSAGGDASMSASIDFKNMPSWVKTAIDDNGKFKNLKVTRSTPQNGRAGSGLGDFSPWAYE